MAEKRQAPRPEKTLEKKLAAVEKELDGLKELVTAACDKIEGTEAILTHTPLSKKQAAQSFINRAITDLRSVRNKLNVKNELREGVVNTPADDTHALMALLGAISARASFEMVFNETPDDEIDDDMAMDDGRTANELTTAVEAIAEPGTPEAADVMEIALVMVDEMVGMSDVGEEYSTARWMRQLHDAIENVYARRRY